MLLIVLLIFGLVKSNNLIDSKKSTDVHNNFKSQLGRLFSAKITTTQTTNNFTMFGITIDFAILNIAELTCDYETTCPTLICNSLRNKTLSNMGLAFLALYPSGSVSCTNFPFISNATMITFIMGKGNKITTPISCDTVGECFTETCILLKNKDFPDMNFMGFMGQCT